MMVNNLPYQRCCEIRVRGRLGPTLLQAFPGLRAEHAGEDTVLRGALRDQGALFGVLEEIDGLGLRLVHVRVDDESWIRVADE
jgi:monoterpene epsilon-lactone hydrolase